MQIPTDNAFTLHRDLQTGTLFPLGIRFWQAYGRAHLHLFPQTVSAVADILERHAAANLVLFCVHQSSQLDPVTKAELPIAALARRAGVAFTPVGEATVVLPKGSLPPLLATFGHYDLTLFDVDDDWQPAEIAEQTARYEDVDWDKEPEWAPGLRSSRLFVESHDDLYLGAEAPDQTLAQELFARTLCYYAGSVFITERGAAPDIVPPPPDLLAALWAGNDALTILSPATQFNGAGLRIGVSRRVFDFRYPLGYAPELWLRYDLASGQWRLDLP